MRDPASVRRLIRLVRGAIGTEVADRHSSAQYPRARACQCARRARGGITTLDASLAGIGGCPFAPGASGNIVTEDLCFMLAAMGLDTGIDLDALLGVRKILAAALPGETLYGFLAEAGLPLTQSAAPR